MSILTKNREEQLDTIMICEIPVERWEKAVRLPGILAVVHCPGCDRTGSLSSLTHSIEAGGRIWPSVICGHDDCEQETIFQIRGYRG